MGMTTSGLETMDEDGLDGEIVYAHEKSLEEVLGEITGKDPDVVSASTRLRPEIPDDPGCPDGRPWLASPSTAPLLRTGSLPADTLLAGTLSYPTQLRTGFPVTLSPDEFALRKLAPKLSAPNPRTKSGAFIHVGAVALPMADPTRLTGTERFSTAVVEAVARRAGVEPKAVDPPLYRAVDPDALDGVLSSMATEGRPGSVSFSYHGYDVTVHDDGRVDLVDPNDPSSAADSAPADE